MNDGVKKLYEWLDSFSLSSKLLLLWLNELFFLSVLRFFLHRIGIDDGIFRALIQIVVASIPLIIFAVNIKKFDYNKLFFPISIITLVFIVFGLTAIFRPDSIEFLIRPSYGIERILRPDCAIYALLFFSIVKDSRELYKTIKAYAFCDFIYIFIFEVIPRLLNGYFEDISASGEIVQRTYSLSFGYSLLLPTIVFLFVAIHQKKIAYLLGAVAGSILIFLYGNRGALLMIAIYLLLEIICNIIDTADLKKKIIKICILAAVMLIILLFANQILVLLANFLQSIGITSRTIRMMASGRAIDSTGRGDIWAASIQGFQQNWLFGNGILGDRPYVFPFHYAAYSHNIFLEMICSFGIPGIIICVLLVFYAFKFLLLCKDKLARGLFIIFFSVSCQLFLSMSFWYVMEFWATIAIAHNYFLCKNPEKSLYSLIVTKVLKKKGLNKS